MRSYSYHLLYTYTSIHPTLVNFIESRMLIPAMSDRRMDQLHKGNEINRNNKQSLLVVLCFALGVHEVAAVCSINFSTICSTLCSTSLHFSSQKDGECACAAWHDAPYQQSAEALRLVRSFGKCGC